MIVCSCNVLSETQILATLRSQDAARRCSAARAYRCLGCAPRCGRCLPSVRALLARAHVANCEVGCETCPGEPARLVDERGETRAPLLIAAE